MNCKRTDASTCHLCINIYNIRFSCHSPSSRQPIFMNSLRGKIYLGRLWSDRTMQSALPPRESGRQVMVRPDGFNTASREKLRTGNSQRVLRLATSARSREYKTKTIDKWLDFVLVRNSVFQLSLSALRIMWYSRPFYHDIKINGLRKATFSPSHYFKVIDR